MNRVPLVSDARAVLSMRESDFDAYSAMGEVVDNSLQANATAVRVLLDYPASGKELVRSVAFGDNGHGMPADVLHLCLQLGYSTRFNDRSGIGRFGVGATLGAINQCKRVDLFSRVPGGQWLYTYVDLDEVTSGDESLVGIMEPVPREPDGKLLALAGDKSGTVVVWSKYDRQPDKGSVMERELGIWLGRTYRKFLWKGIDIYLNDRPMCAIDPLFATTERTRFPNDPPAYEYSEMDLEWPVAEADRRPDGPHTSIVRIRFSLLPEVFRPTQGSGNTVDVRDRCIDRNNGISILRNDREVHYGEIPWWPGEKFQEIDRWWGCEVSFAADLDRAFTVKNIKRGAVPEKELKEAINAKIRGVRGTALESVREVWKRAKADERLAVGSEGLDTGHADAELVGKRTKVPKNVIDSGKNLDEEAGKLASEMGAASEEDRLKWQAKFKSQPFTIHDTQWKGPEFVETNHLGGTDVLKYNMQHAFFAEISDIRLQLEAGGDAAALAVRLKVLIDLLLMSYSKAEASFNASDELRAESFIEQLRMTWGNFLKSYIESWQRDSEPVR